MWLTSEEALARLGTRPQTLYANVSRGRIRARPDPADSRRSLYSAEDVERLAGRRRGRQSVGSIAADAIRWGAPMLESAISTVSNGRLFYRGRDAVDLAATETLEAVATLLWGATDTVAFDAAPGSGVAAADLAPALQALAGLVATAPPSHGRRQVVLRAEAAATYGTLAASLAGRGGKGALHTRIATAWQRPQAAEPIRRVLVLLADHELTSSTFAARVTVSTGASLAAGTLAGLCTLGGPRHGGAAGELQALLRQVEAESAAAAVRQWLVQGRSIPGFGHRLYPAGDIRAAALLEGVALPPPFASLRDEVEQMVGEAPNVDFALAALTSAFELPAQAPLVLFALARGTGWLAHMLEQAATGELIRPRAHYPGAGAPGSMHRQA